MALHSESDLVRERVWLVVRDMADDSVTFSMSEMKRMDSVPQIKTEKVWMEGLAIHDSGGSVTVDVGSQTFTVDRDSVMVSKPTHSPRRKKPLTTDAKRKLSERHPDKW